MMVGTDEAVNIHLSFAVELKVSLPTLEVTQGQILSQYPTYATRFWWHLYGS